MIDDLFLIEKYAYLKSPVHAIDARAKIVLAFSAIIACINNMGPAATWSA